MVLFQNYMKSYYCLKRRRQKAVLSTLMTKEENEARQHNSFWTELTAWNQAPCFLIQIIGALGRDVSGKCTCSNCHQEF